MVTLHLGHLKRMSHIVCFDIDFFLGENNWGEKKLLCKMVSSSKSWKIRCDDRGLMRWPILQICHLKSHCQSRECFAPFVKTIILSLHFWVPSDGIRKKIMIVTELKKNNSLAQMMHVQINRPSTLQGTIHWKPLWLNCKLCYFALHLHR
jgi:hypothetical protein